MGTTATSLHILATLPGIGAELQKEIEKGYRRLGYTRPKQAGATIVKRVVSAPDASGDWVSIYDSGNADMDSGELKQIAVELTRKLGTVAVLTSVYDSDTFEFVMFHSGKQTDAAVSDPDCHSGGLKMLKGKRRADSWYSMFIGRDLPRAVTLGSTGQLRADWKARLKTPPRATTPFAEDELANWCTLAGLTPENAVRSFAEAVALDGQPSVIFVDFERAAVKAAKDVAPNTAEPLLKYYRSDDDCPYRRFFPAPWPVSIGTANSFQWAIVCGGRLSGLRVHVRIEGLTSARVDRIAIRALPFYNGQITSLNSIAQHEWVALDDSTTHAREIVVEMLEFLVPAADPQSRRQVILLLILQATLSDQGEATIVASVETLDGKMPSPDLPPLRLCASKPAWKPLVSHSSSREASRELAILRLNCLSVCAAVAILKSSDAPAWQKAQALAESWLTQLNPQPETMAIVQTLKHMSASFNISKSSKTVPFAELIKTKTWTRLFSEEADNQSVFVGLSRSDSPHAHAGLTIQTSLRAFGGLLGGETLGCAIWAIEHEVVRQRLGAGTDTGVETFVRWIETVEPQQAWIGRAAWIPEFDTYEDFMQTAYESAVTRDWHKNDKPPRRPWLRYVAPQLWLDQSFLDDLDMSRVEAAARLRKFGRTTAISLRPERTLNELEEALSPILPRFSGVGPLRNEA